jgi:hypothetical protein
VAPPNMDGVMTAPTRWLPWDEGVVGVSESSGGSPLSIPFVSAFPYFFYSSKFDIFILFKPPLLWKTIFEPTTSHHSLLGSGNLPSSSDSILGHLSR